LCATAIIGRGVVAGVTGESCIVYERCVGALLAISSAWYCIIDERCDGALPVKSPSLASFGVFDGMGLAGVASGSCINVRKNCDGMATAWHLPAFIISERDADRKVQSHLS
jgi:hypothetical protein